MLDTSVAIHLRDGDAGVRDHVLGLDETPVLSIITQVELEGGVTGPDAALRRQRLDALFAILEVLPFQAADAAIYRAIISSVGFSRRKTMDRLIAAQAISIGAALATMNGDDFRDIPHLTLLEW